MQMYLQVLNLRFVDILTAAEKKAGAGSRSVPVSQWYGSTDPDPYQNVTDPQH